MNKRAALYDEKRICEAERKRRERKAKTIGPSADSLIFALLAVDKIELLFA